MKWNERGASLRKELVEAACKGQQTVKIILALGKINALELGITISVTSHDSLVSLCVYFLEVYT